LINNKNIGNKGEEFATSFLYANGYEVQHKNFRFGRAEIDIIAEHNSSLVFIEVKTRKNNNYGFPESFVSDSQRERIYSAAEEYVNKNDWKGEIRFDILAITWDGKSEPIVEHFEDAF
jgi:putative endonuclease